MKVLSHKCYQHPIVYLYLKWKYILNRHKIGKHYENLIDRILPGLIVVAKSLQNYFRILVYKVSKVDRTVPLR